MTIVKEQQSLTPSKSIPSEELIHCRKRAAVVLHCSWPRRLIRLALIVRRGMKCFVFVVAKEPRLRKIELGLFESETLPSVAPWRSFAKLNHVDSCHVIPSTRWQQLESSSMFMCWTFSGHGIWNGCDGGVSSLKPGFEGRKCLIGQTGSSRFIGSVQWIGRRIGESLTHIHHFSVASRKLLVKVDTLWIFFLASLIPKWKWHFWSFWPLRWSICWPATWTS